MSSLYLIIFLLVSLGDKLLFNVGSEAEVPSSSHRFLRSGISNEFDSSEVSSSSMSASASSISSSSLSSSSSSLSSSRFLQSSATVVEWRAYGWDQCTVPCGGGVQRRKVICWGNATQAETNPSFCPIQRPASAQACNTFPCPTQDVTEFSCDSPYIATSTSSSSSSSLLSSSSSQVTVGCTPQLKGGGRLTIQILKGNNLPNHELYPTISQVSDPYFKVKIKNIVRETGFIMNNVLNPSWTNATGEMFFGIQDSQTPIHIELWDSDGGFEGEDELLGEINTHVIACSAFSLLPKDVYCVEQAWLPLKKGDDCLLQSTNAATGKVTRNATLVNPLKPCVLIRQIVETFNVTSGPPSASSLSFSSSAEAASFNENPYSRSWGTNISIANEYSIGLKTVGSLYIEDTLMHADVFFDPFARARSGLIIRSSNFSKTLGSNYSIMVKTNYRCTVYLFRYFLDGRFNQTPQWLLSGSWSLPALESSEAVLARPMAIDNITHVNTTFGAFRAYIRSLSAYQSLILGGPMAGFIVLDNATVNETNAREPSDYMYFAIMRQVTDDEEVEVVITPTIDRLEFIFLLPRFLILEVLFVILALPFLREVKFRHDLIKPYLATRLLPLSSSSSIEGHKKDANEGKGKISSQSSSSTSSVISQSNIHILASALLVHPHNLRLENARRRLFRQDFRKSMTASSNEDASKTQDLEKRFPPYLNVPNNGSSSSFQRNLFWIQLAMESLCALPFLINITHGITLLLLAKPPAMGLLVLFVGSAFYVLLYGLGQWSSNGYRPTASTIHSIALSTVLIFAYLYGSSLSGEAPLRLRLPVVTSITATASFLPMVMLIFLNSEEMNDSLTSINNLVRVVRAEEAEAAARARDELKRRAEAAGLGQGTLALDIKEAKRKVAEGGVDITAALGVPSSTVQSIGNILGSSALVCYDYALDPFMKPPDPEKMSEQQYADAKAKFEAQKAAIEMKRRLTERAEKERIKAAVRAAKRKAASTHKTEQLFSDTAAGTKTGGSSTDKDDDDWDRVHKERVSEVIGRVKDETRKLVEESQKKDEEATIEQQKEYEAILAEELVFAKEDAKRRELAESGASLGLSKNDDRAMRLAAVSSSPWLQAGLHKTKKINHLGQRSPTLLLGVLLGSQVFSLPGAAPSSELDYCDGAVGLLSSHPLIITRLSRICLLTSYTILALHAFFTTALFPPGYSFDGFICAASFGGQDFVIYCLVSSFLYKRGPIFTCLVLAIARISISWFAGEWWLAGQSIAFAAWGIVLGLDAGRNRLPVIPKHIAEFICFMSQFTLGADFATVLKKVEIAARRYQREIAAIYQINLQHDYVAEDKANRAAKMAEQQRRNRIKEAGGNPDAVLSEEAEEEAKNQVVKKDPYDVKDLLSSRQKENELKKQKTPFADRYKPAVVNANGATNNGKVKKDESKIVRTEAARLLALGAAAEAKSKPPPRRNRSSAKVHPALSGGSPRKNKNDNFDNEDDDEEEDNEDDHSGAKSQGGQVSTTYGNASSVEVDEILGAVEAPTIRKRPQEQSLFTEVIAMREAWSALTVITSVFMSMWGPTTLYYEVSSYLAYSEPKYRAGLFDSESVFPVPKVNFFGNKVRTWVVGLACIAAVIIFILLATAVSAVELRKGGLLPLSFDILLPYMTKFKKDLRRIAYPDFVFYSGVASTIFFGLIFYRIGNSSTTLIFSIFVIPLLVLIASATAQFIKNGYSVLQPTTFRPKIAPNDLLRLNARAGFPLALRYEYSAWVQRMNGREKELLMTLERGPTGEGRPLFEHPAAVGDGHYDPDTTVDFSMLELYGASGVGFQASTAEAAVRKIVAINDSSKRKDQSLAAKSTFSKKSSRGVSSSSGSANEEDEEADDESGATPAEKAKAKIAREQRRVEMLNQKVAAKTTGFIGKITQLYYRWKLRVIDIESLGFWGALFRGYLTKTDISTIGSMISIIVLFMMSAILCTAAGESGPGVIISSGVALVPLIIMFSLPPAVTYVSTNKLTFDLFSCFLISISLTVLCLVYFISSLLTVEGYDERTAYLIGITSIYWGGLSAYIAVSSFIHHKFKFKLTSAILFAIAAFLLFVLVIIVAGWGGLPFALALTIAILSLGWAFIALAVKARNGGHLPSCFLRFGTVLMAVFCVFSLFLSFFLSSNLFLLWSVAFGALVIHFGGRALTRLLLLDKESPIVFGPLLFPVLSYNVKTGQPVDESQLGADVAATLMIFFIWGASAASFMENAFVGSSLCCLAICTSAVVFCATSSYAVVQIGKLAPYIDTDAVRGARVSAGDAFFSRRRLARPSGLANTGRGTTVVDSFSAAEIKFSNEYENRKFPQGAGGGGGGGTSTVTGTGTATNPALNETLNAALIKRSEAHTAGSAAVKSFSTQELEGLVERSLSFLDPSLRGRDAEATKSLSQYRSLFPRDNCAKGLAQIACMEWCSENKWPWQISESELNAELYLDLATRFKVSAEEVIEQHKKILSRYTSLRNILKKVGICFSPEMALRLAGRDLEVLIKNHVTKALDDFSNLSDTSDVDMIRDILERHELVAPTLTDFSISLTNAINARSNVLEAERAKKLAEARVWHEDMLAKGLRRKGPAPMLGALGKTNMLGKSMRGSLMRIGSKKRGISAPTRASVQNLNDILGTRATSLALGIDTDTSDPSSSSSSRRNSRSGSLTNIPSLADINKNNNNGSNRTLKSSLSSKTLTSEGSKKRLSLSFKENDSSTDSNTRSASMPPSSSSFSSSNSKFQSSVSKVVSLLALMKSRKKEENGEEDVNNENGDLPAETPLPVLPSSASKKDLMAKGDVLRTLQNASKKALKAGPTSSKNRGSLGRSASLQNARASMKKGTGDDNANEDPDEIERRKWATERQADLITVRYKTGSTAEVIERWFSEMYDYLFGIPLGAIPPPIPPPWHHAIERGDAGASDDFVKTETKKGVVLHAMTSYKNVADTGQLAAVLMSPLYAPVIRSDRPWSLGDALFDALIIGAGPFGFISFYGIFYRSLSYIFEIVFLLCCCCCGPRKRTKSLNENDTVGCCLRRAPVHPVNTLPPETEAERLAKQWKESSGKSIDLVCADGGGAHLFPLPSNNEGGDNDDIDFHGIIGASRSHLFGIATVGTGWTPDEPVKDLLRPLFEPRTPQVIQSAQNRLKAYEQGGKDLILLMDEKNSKNAKISHAVDRILSGDVLFSPIKTDSSTSSMKMRIAVSDDGGKVLGIEENNQKAVDAADHIEIFNRLLSAHATATSEFYEEFRALLHFQMLLISYGSSRREAQLARYPSFLKEAKKSLYDAGCPKMDQDIASAAALSSGKKNSASTILASTLSVEKVDLVLTACWLSRLPPYFQQEYSMMKRNFDAGLRAYKRSQLVGYKSLMVKKIQRDEEIEIRGRMLIESSRKFSQELEEEIRDNLFKQRQEAVAIASSTAANTKKSKRGASSSTLSVPVKKISVDDTTLGHWLVNRIENKREFCSISAGGSIRPFQFVDTEFPPTGDSVGVLSRKAMTSFVKGRKWQQSLALNPQAVLFRGGTDPDDVMQGVAVSDSWLLSAICMLATSGSVGDGNVDPLLARVFVVKRETRVGVYCMRVFVAGQWIPIILDDFFPVVSIPGDPSSTSSSSSRQSSRQASRQQTLALIAAIKPRIEMSRNAAFAHSPNFGELWVPLLEKAVAKVFGSYSELNKGYLEQALQLFTGAETQRIPIQVIADSPLRARLWQDMLVYCNQCRYMIGAETFAPPSNFKNERSDKEGGVETPLDTAFLTPGTLLYMKGVPGGAVPFLEGIEPKLLLPGAVLNAPSLQPLLVMSDLERRMLCASDPKLWDLKLREKKYNERYTEEEEMKQATWKTMRIIIEDFRRAVTAHQVLLASDPQNTKRNVDAAIALAADVAVQTAIDESSFTAPDGHYQLKNGLASSCVYNIDKVVEAAGKRLIRFREPPSTRSKWRGSFSEHSSDWDLAIISAVKWKPEQDKREKCFWMNFDDFCANFLCLHVCRVYDEGDGWRQTTAAGAWLGPTAAGLSRQKDGSQSDIHLNPQFALDVHEPTSFCFTLRQFPRKIANDPGNTPYTPYTPYTPLRPVSQMRTGLAMTSEKNGIDEVKKKRVKMEKGSGDEGSVSSESDMSSDDDNNSTSSSSSSSSSVSSENDVHDAPPSSSSSSSANLGKSPSREGRRVFTPDTNKSPSRLSSPPPLLPSSSLSSLSPQLPQSRHPVSLYIVSRAGEETVRMDLENYSPNASSSSSNSSSAVTGTTISSREKKLSNSVLGREIGSSISSFDIASFPPLMPLTDGRVYGLTSSNVVATSGKPSDSVSGVRLYCTLPAGRYTILCATEFEKCEGQFGLSVESTSKIKLSKMWPPEVSSYDFSELKKLQGSEGESGQRGGGVEGRKSQDQPSAKQDSAAVIKVGEAQLQKSPERRGGVGGDLIKLKKKRSVVAARVLSSYSASGSWFVFHENRGALIADVSSTSSDKKGTGEGSTTSTSRGTSKDDAEKEELLSRTEYQRGLFTILVLIVSKLGELIGRFLVVLLRSFGFLDAQFMSVTYKARLGEMNDFVEKCIEYKEIQDEIYETAVAFFDHNTGAPRQGKHMPVFQSKVFSFRPEDEPIVAAYTSSFFNHDDDVDNEEEGEEGGHKHRRRHHRDTDDEDQVGTDNPTVSDDGDDNSSDNSGEQGYEEAAPDEHDYVQKT